VAADGRVVAIEIADLLASSLRFSGVARNSCSSPAHPRHAEVIEFVRLAQPAATGKIYRYIYL
jgi:hypothetical protein